MPQYEEMGHNVAHMQHPDFSWDDLRFALAVAEHGSVRAAGRELGVNHATVWRRIQKLQEGLNTQLFERKGRSFHLTAKGRELIRLAAEVEEKVHRVQRELAGGDEEECGVVRVALPNSFVGYVGEALRKLRVDYPRISIDLVTSLELANLNQRDADIAIRLMESPHDTLVGRRVGRLRFELSGHRKLIKQLGARDASEYPWVSWEDRFDWPPLREERAFRGTECVVACADSPEGIFQLVNAGVGIGFIQRPMAMSSEELQPVPIRAPSLSSDVWILTHQDLRGVTRIKTVMDGIAQSLAQVLET